MNRLLLAFGLVCILQCVLPYELPNIQFDTGPFDANTLLAANDGNITGQIKAMITAINVTEMQAITNASNGNVTGQIKDMITAINLTETQDIMNASGLLAANDGNFTEEFNATITATITVIYEMVDYFAKNSIPAIVVVYAQNLTGMADQLSDAFRHITYGMFMMRDKVVIIQKGIQAAINSEATVNVDIWFLLRTVWDLQRAAINLIAILPLWMYVLTIAMENLMEADNYVTELETLLYTGELTESGKYVQDIGRIANETIDQVIRDVTNENLKAYHIGNEIQFFKNIQDAPRYEDLVTVAIDLSVFFTNTKFLKQLKTMVAAFANISTSLTSRPDAMQAGFNDIPLFMQLVYTLLGNDEYGRYCYVKYKVQSMDIFSNIFDSAWQCVDNEYERLEYLKTTLRLMVELLPLDHEDFLEQVKICDNHTSGDNLNNCVAALAYFYTNLFPQTTNKISTILQFATDEAAASENRIVICIELVYIEETFIEPQKISDNLAICNRDGPKGLD